MKAQIFATDFIISFIIFFSVIILVIMSWNYTSSQASDQLEFNDIENTALVASDSLIRSSGIPSDWSESNVSVIGLAEDDGVLNETKLVRFVNTSYSTSRGLLTGIYNFYFQVRYMNNSVIKVSNTNLVAGIYPANERIVVPIERYILFHGKPAKMQFIVWV